MTFNSRNRAGRTPCPPDAGRYLTWVALVAVVALLPVWAYIVYLPAAVLDEEYGSWLAKREMLRDCNTAPVLVLGDSRAMVGIIPALMLLRTTNMALGGGSPIESYYMARKVLRCPDPPKVAIIAIDLLNFEVDEIFWERSIRFGFLTPGDVSEVMATARRLNDDVLRQAKDQSGLPLPLLPAVYEFRFPPLYFAGLTNWRQHERYVFNTGTAAEVYRDRGYMSYGDYREHETVGSEALTVAFRPSPLLDHYFNRTLDLLSSQGIRVDFVPVPIGSSTCSHLSEQVKRGFGAYLGAYASRYPRLHLVGSGFACWPDQYFVDGHQHLSSRGAVLFSQWLAGCLSEELCGTAGLEQLAGSPSPLMLLNPALPAVH